MTTIVKEEAPFFDEETTAEELLKEGIDAVPEELRGAEEE